MRRIVGVIALSALCGTATAQVMQRPETRQSLARDRTEVSTSRSPEGFAAFLREEAKLWARLARESGAKSD